MYTESMILLLLIVTFAGGFLCGRHKGGVTKRSRLANDAALVARARAGSSS